MSRIHCQIIEDGRGNYLLIDTNSENGTYVNGIERRDEVRLNRSDVVRIGNTTLPWQTYFSMDENSVPHVHVPAPAPVVPPATYEAKPDNFLIWAILCSIFCCLPFGIASIVNASEVDSRWRAGDYEGARRSARQARTWFWVSFGVGLSVTVIYIVYYMIMGVAIGSTFITDVQ